MTPRRLEILLALLGLAGLVILASGCIAPSSGNLGPDSAFHDALAPEKLAGTPANPKLGIEVYYASKSGPVLAQPR